MTASPRSFGLPANEKPAAVARAGWKLFIRDKVYVNFLPHVNRRQQIFLTLAPLLPGQG
jgi:hypothetical protein